MKNFKEIIAESLNEKISDGEKQWGQLETNEFPKAIRMLKKKGFISGGSISEKEAKKYLFVYKNGKLTDIKEA